MFTASSIVSIISILLGLAKFFTNYAAEQKWIDAGAAEATLKGLQDANDAIKKGNEARAAARDLATRDPASVLRDDEFKRPD